MRGCCRHYETAFATCVSCFQEDKEHDSFQTYQWLEPVFRKLWDIYDEYIEYMGKSGLPEDLPWIYTERSIVGHLTAAAYLANRIAIEEFQQPKEEGQAGRADWWMGTNDRIDGEINVETKYVPISSNADSWKTLQSTLDKAEAQLQGYGFPYEPGQSEQLIMCFVQPHFSATEDHEKIEEHRQRWCEGDAKCPDRVDYFVGYWLKDLKGREVQSKDNDKRKVLCPGLFIYCREVKPKDD